MGEAIFVGAVSGDSVSGGMKGSMVPDAGIGVVLVVGVMMGTSRELIDHKEQRFILFPAHCHHLRNFKNYMPTPHPAHSKGTF